MVIEVIPVGTQVLVDSSTPAYITKVIIQGHGISYECVWWSDNQRNCEELEEWEVRLEGPLEKQRVCSIL